MTVVGNYLVIVRRFKKKKKILQKITAKRGTALNVVGHRTEFGTNTNRGGFLDVCELSTDRRCVQGRGRTTGKNTRNTERPAAALTHVLRQERTSRARHRPGGGRNGAQCRHLCADNRTLAKADGSFIFTRLCTRWLHAIFDGPRSFPTEVRITRPRQIPKSCFDSEHSSVFECRTAKRHCDVLYTPVLSPNPSVSPGPLWRKCPLIKKRVALFNRIKCFGATADINSVNKLCCLIG